MTRSASMRWSGRVAAVAMAAIVLPAGCGDDGEAAGGDADECRVVEIVPGPTLPEGDESFERTVAESFCSTFTWQTTTYEPAVSSEDAACIAERLVDELGPSRLREMWSSFGGRPWHLLLFTLANHQGGSGIDRAEAEAIAEAFERCSPEWKLLLMRTVTEGTDEMSPESAACTSAELSDEDARRILIGELDAAYADPSQPDAEPFAELITPLIEAFETCLTPAELDRLDWN